MQIHFYMSDTVLDAPGIAKLPRELHRLIRLKLGVQRDRVTIKEYESVKTMPCRIYEAYEQAEACDQTVPVVILITMRYTPERELLEKSVSQAILTQVFAHSTKDADVGVMTGIHYYQ